MEIKLRYNYAIKCVFGDTDILYSDYSTPNIDDAMAHVDAALKHMWTHLGNTFYIEADGKMIVFSNDSRADREKGLVIYWEQIGTHTSQMKKVKLISVKRRVRAFLKNPMLKLLE